MASFFFGYQNSWFVIVIGKPNWKNVMLLVYLQLNFYANWLLNKFDLLEYGNVEIKPTLFSFSLFFCHCVGVGWRNEECNHMLVTVSYPSLYSYTTSTIQVGRYLYLYLQLQCVKQVTVVCRSVWGLLIEARLGAGGATQKHIATSRLKFEGWLALWCMSHHMRHTRYTPNEVRASVMLQIRGHTPY